MREGFLIGAGLIIAGLMLELSVGPVVWDAFRWPVNGIVLGVFMLMIAAFYVLRKQVYAFHFMGTYQAAIPALVYAVCLTVIMGLTRQTVGGTWINNMLTFWPFVLIYVYLAVILGLATIRQASTLTFRPSLLLHLGLFIAMTTATLGNADMQRLKMITAIGEPEWRALDQQGNVREMPVAIELKRFIMETYDDGSPSRYASDIQILTQTGKNIVATVDVNKPVEVDGWRIYQYGYDTQMGAQSNTSILELVSDPWLPAVYAGFYIMLAGIVCLLLFQLPWRQWASLARRHPKRSLLLALLVAAVFVCVHHFMPILHSDKLVPALQSPWFVPHIVAYMIAYTLLGAAAVLAVWMLTSRHALLSSIDNLVYVGLAFMTIGMLFGALWAKEAWGHYWSWDPKETWAAITWFSYLVYIHYRRLPYHHPRLVCLLLLVCFALLQMCWWGINFLPSAQGSSVHVYGQ